MLSAADLAKYGPESEAYWQSVTDRMRDLGQTDQEIALLIDHDAGEELHAFRPRNREPFPFMCSYPNCGDTAEGLMHNNTWRNVEPLLLDSF